MSFQIATTHMISLFPEPVQRQQQQQQPPSKQHDQHQRQSTQQQKPPQQQNPPHQQQQQNHNNNNRENNIRRSNNEFFSDKNVSTAEKQVRDHVLIVTDSNGTKLRPHQLKPDAIVTKEFRFNLKEAITRVPNKITEPENVTDIVFQVGFNDVRKSFLSPQEAREKTFEMQQVYHEHFPNARQHITALPPMNDKLKSTNALLQKLANHTESNFIHTKVFSDRASGNLRANVMEGIHYNDWGVRLLTKEIKKSLYSHANKENNRLTALLKTNPPPQENQTPSAPSPPPLPPPQENQPSSAPPPPPPPPQENQPSSTPSATLDEDYTDLLRQLS